MFTESIQDAWRLRYGQDAPTQDDRIAPFLRHRSVRAFADTPIDEGLIQLLVGCAQSAATSSNLQTYSLVSVQDPTRRAEISTLCGDQKQIVSSSWFFAFVADLWRLHESSTAEGEEPNACDTVEMYTVAAIDAALAAERMVVAAEACGIGICYIGALRNDPVAVKELLGLPPLTAPLFGLCLGYPTLDSSAEIKPRLGQHALWFREAYDSEMDLSEYESRMREFYEAQGMNAEIGWAKRNGRRASDAGLSGREHMREFLNDQGLDRR